MDVKIILKIHLQLKEGNTISTISLFRSIENKHNVYKG